MFLFELIGAASLAVWIYLLVARGGFWLVRMAPIPKLAAPEKSVVVVIPARNEEAVVGRAIESIINQDYSGSLHIILVDDHSEDATVAAAGTHERLSIIEAGPLPKGWTGKLWAVSEGLKRASELNPGYILLTDADIVHAPSNIAGLVARAEAGGLDLVSYMVKLECKTLAERALIPAFVFFFLKLYPPAWIARRDRKTAGAAGGCMLIRPAALERIGGIEAIHGQLIDDCALARAVKQGGDIWIGLTDETRSIREYATFRDILRMISRSAFTQLHHSTLLLAGTILGMAVIYLAPPFLIWTGNRVAAAYGIAAWILMMIAYVPTLRFYRRSMLWALVLPLVALFYMIATFDSAIRYFFGRGGLWKGRVQDTGG
ncbi:MAG TPA: glycosyltransferase [Bryobacteraceae bacterium]|nr:glycosyltransferase [Bryobacteraceae bacterium]